MSRQDRQGRAASLWPDRDRLLVYAAILLSFELAAFLFFVAGAHGWIVPLARPASTDFVSFYAAGMLAKAGTPWLAYDRAAHFAAEQATAGAGIAYNYFYYPPVFLLACAGLAHFPYTVAYVLFQAVGGLGCFAAARAIRRDLPWYAMAAFPAFWWTIGTGQNALITTALFAAGTAAIDRRPWITGLCFGALCYKPHFGLLIPVALVAGGHWRAIAWSGAAVAMLAAGSAVLFGTAAWAAFFAAAAAPGDVYAARAIFMGGLTSPYGVAMVLGAGREAAIGLQIAVVVAIGWAVARVWRAGAPLPERAAVLLAATPVAVPVMMFYDLMLVFMALLWLSRAGPGASGRRGEMCASGRRGEMGAGARRWSMGAGWRRWAMGVVFVAPLFSGNLYAGTPPMLAAAVAAGCFGLALEAAWPWLRPRQ